jgi:hypothetical protein
MIWFFTRGDSHRSCETRLAAESEGYELVVTTDEGMHVERFGDLHKLLAREHEVLAAWRAQGWMPVRQARDSRPSFP